MDKEITFDLEEFLNEDCKEENEIGIKMTCSILRKAFEKGLQNGTLYSYEKGMKDAKTEFIAMLTELQDELKYTNLSGVWKSNYAEGFNDSVATSVKKIQRRIDMLRSADNGQES